MDGLTPIRFDGRRVELIDQRRLPGETRWLTCERWEAVADAIRDMAIRGAPAIGIAAGYGIALAARSLVDAGGALRTGAPEGGWAGALGPAFEGLAATRPTAVNLFWALERMRRRLNTTADESGTAVCAALGEEARAIHVEDVAMCRAIGDHGAALFPEGARVLTHCNTGALATGGFGTALGVIRSAHAQGRLSEVLAGETRPYLQGARLTAWELREDAIPVRLITDSMAGWLMRQGEIDCVIVGADRVAANGDVANKIGTYALAVLSHHHQVPFYVAAPSSTVDLAVADGGQIPIEERGPDEVTRLGGVTIAPAGVSARNPAFDVTPNALVTALITEHGVLRSPYGPALAALRAPAGQGPDGRDNSNN